MREELTVKSQDVLVKVDRVSKKFCRSLKLSLWYGVQDVISELFGISRSKSLRKKEFWAVDNISFELRRGECLGLIGHNGAGKSTLLKMLNGLIKPDDGQIEIFGKVSALIELGAGFNPVLTGRENIYNNAAVLGFSKSEVEEKFQDIVDFAEIGDFLDTPVRNYSSGMKVRLGFAVASQMEPDVLIIDEVLAVGDMGFKLKCFNVIDKLLENTAVIFVSHAMPQISRLCSTALLMEAGKKKSLSVNVSKVIEQFYGKFDIKPIILDKAGEILLDKFEFKTDVVEEGIPCFSHLDNFVLDLEFIAEEKYNSAVTTISVLDKEQRPIGICFDRSGLDSGVSQRRKDGLWHHKKKLTIPRINLSAGIYILSMTISESFRSKPIFKLQSFTKFQVTSENVIWPPIEFESDWN